MENHSPRALTARRFFRNRLAVTGLVLLGVMFLFSFWGGALSPYKQDQVFYREDIQRKEFAAVTENTAYRFAAAPGQRLDAVLQARLTLALETEAGSLVHEDAVYLLKNRGEALYEIYQDQMLLGIAHKDLLQDAPADFTLLRSALLAYTGGENRFTAAGVTYTLTQDGTVFQDGSEIGHISRFILRPKVSGEPLTRAFRDLISQSIEAGTQELIYEGKHYTLVYDRTGGVWSVREEVLTRVWDSYAAPSRKHPLGTDKNGMDMLTRLMYGGRVSLVIGFIVVIIAGLLGVLLGGIAGYFGGWADELVMRLVDIFYCIPATPLLIILGAAMDALRVDPQIRILLLMLILGFLGWPAIARLVRGQILSLREQEFMTATEAAGLGAGRRIFRHLIPGVIPQLIVTCTMRLGSTILTEATLSFLGLGVKFPFASWGNIMNDVGNVHVLTSYWFVWIPAGICLVLAVLGFNFVGDGLRDAFDPKMKR